MVHSSKQILVREEGSGKQFCTSFQSASDDLCFALVARHLCTDGVNPSGVSALVACRLITLSKCPGDRPIGVGEAVRRIIGKAVLTTLKMEILEVAALCKAGCRM